MKVYDKDGWPVERINGRPFINILRCFLHIDIIWTIKQWIWPDGRGNAKSTK